MRWLCCFSTADNEKATQPPPTPPGPARPPVVSYGDAFAAAGLASPAISTRGTGNSSAVVWVAPTLLPAFTKPCGCASGCATNRCGCRKRGNACSAACGCRSKPGGERCCNSFAQLPPPHTPPPPPPPPRVRMQLPRSLQCGKQRVWHGFSVPCHARGPLHTKLIDLLRDINVSSRRDELAAAFGAGDYHLRATAARRSRSSVVANAAASAGLQVDHTFECQLLAHAVEHTPELRSVLSQVDLATKKNGGFSTQPAVVGACLRPVYDLQNSGRELGFFNLKLLSARTLFATARPVCCAHPLRRRRRTSTTKRGTPSPRSSTRTSRPAAGGRRRWLFAASCCGGSRRRATPRPRRRWPRTHRPATTSTRPRRWSPRCLLSSRLQRPRSWTACATRQAPLRCRPPSGGGWGRRRGRTSAQARWRMWLRAWARGLWTHTERDRRVGCIAHV